MLMQLINGYYSPQDPELFREIYNSLLNTNNSDQGRYLLHPEGFPFLCGGTETRRGSLPRRELVGEEQPCSTRHAPVSSPLTVPSRSMCDDIWHLEKIHVDDDDVKAL